ncbi:AAEL011886-PA, partial [Aedes aegypti]
RLILEEGRKLKIVLWVGEKIFKTYEDWIWCVLPVWCGSRTFPVWCDSRRFSVWCGCSRFSVWRDRRRIPVWRGRRRIPVWRGRSNSRAVNLCPLVRCRRIQFLCGAEGVFQEDVIRLGFLKIETTFVAVWFS